MKKIKYLFVFLMFYFVPLFVRAEQYTLCGTDNKIPSGIITIVHIALVFIKIAVPVLLVISGMISFFKVVIAGKVGDELNSAKKKLISSIIAACLVFLIFPIINTVVNFIAGKGNDLMDCVRCFNDPLECGLIYIEEDELKVGLYTNIYDNKVNPDLGNGGISSGNSSSHINANVKTNYSDELIEGEYKINDSFTWRYYLYTPSLTDSSRPLIVNMHGNYTQGTNLKRLEEDGGFAAHLKNGTKYPSFILLPLLPSGCYWGDNSDKLIKLIDYIASEYDIDKSRISLTGFSMGANIIPEFVNRYPGYFHRTAIMSIQFNASNIASFKNVPTWIFYGVDDPYAGGCQPLYNSLNNAGYDVRITSYQNQGHAYLPKRVLDDDSADLVNWLIS